MEGFPDSKRCKSVWSISFYLDHEGNPLPPLWRDFLIPNDVNQFGLYLRPIISGISDQCYMFRLMTFEVLKLVNQFGLYLFPRDLIILKWMKKSYVSFTVSLVKL